MHQDKHQAPTHLRIRPLSLQNAGDARVPMGVITLFDWKNSLGSKESHASGLAHRITRRRFRELVTGRSSSVKDSSHSIR